MSLFVKGILLEQKKEPMLSRNILIMKQDYHYFDCDYPEVPTEDLTPKQIIGIARLAGIVDESDGKLLADKLEKAGDHEVGTFVVDAIDDEPYVSSQMCMVLHQQEKLSLGIELCQKVARPGETYIAVYKHIFDTNISLPASVGETEIRKIGGRYPAEERAYRHIPKEKGSLIVGTNALVHLARAVEDSRKMTSCFLTVAGDAVANPYNIEVPIGTAVSTILEKCGLSEEPEVIVVGGSMTGRSIFEPEEEKVGPTTRCVLAMTKSNRAKATRCIGCGRCDHACPATLSVCRIRKLSEFGQKEKLRDLDVELCTGCGACSYVCPARLDVATSVLMAKRSVLAEKGGKEGV